MPAAQPWLTAARVAGGRPATRMWQFAQEKLRHAESIRGRAFVPATAVIAADSIRVLGIRYGHDFDLPTPTTANGDVRGPQPWRHPVRG